MHRAVLLAAAVLVVAGLGDAHADGTQAPVGTIVLRVHAVGAQIYECKAGPGSALAWGFREPIAALMSDGKTVGRHFAGPTWEMEDGSFVVGHVVDKAAGASASDVPWLKLEVSRHGGEGILTGVTVVQRVDTIGGNRSGVCQTAGGLSAEPYAADYVFSRP